MIPELRLLPRRIPLPPKPPGHFNFYLQKVHRCLSCSSLEPGHGIMMMDMVRRRLKSTRRHDRGLTLAEIIIAMGLLAFGALSVVAVFLALLQSSAKNREQAMAELLAESLLEKAASIGPPDWGVDERLGERLEAQLEADGTKFFYQVEAQPVSPKSSPWEGEPWRLTVTVGWWLQDEAPRLESSRVGFGDQYVRGVRTVYWRPGESR